jgi:hypothetical protein
MKTVRAENASLWKEFVAFKLGKLEVEANAHAAGEQAMEEEVAEEEEEEEDEEEELPDPMVELAAELEAAMAEQVRARLLLEQHMEQALYVWPPRCNVLPLRTIIKVQADKNNL